MRTAVELALGAEPKMLISGELSGCSQACQQEVEVYQSSIRLPATNRTLHSGIIIEWLVAAQPEGQTIARAYIVTGKDAGPSEPAKQYILGRLPPYTTQLHQRFDRLCIIYCTQLLQIDLSLNQAARQIEQ
jgi:hypothetical protein